MDITEDTLQRELRILLDGLWVRFDNSGIHLMKELRMMRLIRIAMVAAVTAIPVVGAFAQMSIEPPSPASTQPNCAGDRARRCRLRIDSTGRRLEQPVRANVLEGLLKDKPQTASDAPADETPVNQGIAIRTAEPAVPNVAPNAPKTNRVREGEFVWNRTGRLVRDEKSASWFFAFDADGKNMKDPPMGLIPSRLLKVMEDASSEGSQPMRFKVSGEVTEYAGKNYLWVQHMEIMRNLNKGIGG